MNITVRGLDEVINKFDGAVKGYPAEVSKFLRKEGNALKREVTAKAKERIKKKTGNYLNGITAQNPYKYYKETGGRAKDSVKVYGRRKTIEKKGKTKKGAPHTHLIEKGHEKVLWGRRTEEFVRAFYIYRDAGKEYEGKFEGNAERFVDEAVRKLLW